MVDETFCSVFIVVQIDVLFNPTSALAALSATMKAVWLFLVTYSSLQFGYFIIILNVEFIYFRLNDISNNEYCNIDSDAELYVGARVGP